jgi:Ring finger domain/PA domain
MTIPRDWCSACEDHCRDHATVCTICGQTLQLRPVVTRVMSSSSSSLHETNGQRVAAESMFQGLHQSNQDLIMLLGSIRERVSTMRQQASELRQWVEEQSDIFDPQATPSRSRPTSSEFLRNLPRIQIRDNLSLFQQATIEIDGITYEALCGDFGPSPPTQLNDRFLVLAEPRTGKGGKLNPKLYDIVQTECPGAIMYMERGDGVTFVQKAIAAQEIGASAVIVSNSTSKLWPYVMQDTKKEAIDLGLKIPIVMVKQSDGMQILESFRYKVPKCTLAIDVIVKECIICVDCLAVGQTALKLPACGHIFHESCAMMWLTNHHSCPYCRGELPTDDDENDQQRRELRPNTLEPSPNNSTERNSDSFYG